MQNYLPRAKALDNYMYVCTCTFIYTLYIHVHIIIQIRQLSHTPVVTEAVLGVDAELVPHRSLSRSHVA